MYQSLHVLDNVQKVGAYLGQKLDELADKFPKIVEHRGVGLIHGLEFSEPVGGIIEECQRRGLILINAGSNILRFVPPLVITEQDVDDMLAILEPVLEERK